MKALFIVTCCLAVLWMAGCQLAVEAVAPPYVIVWDDNTGGPWTDGVIVSDTINDPNGVGVDTNARTLRGIDIGAGSEAHFAIEFNDVRHHKNTKYDNRHVERGETEITVHINTWAP